MADIKTEKQKVKEITDRLEEGLKELFESEKYKSYLSTMSKFYSYSFNNTLLIAMQKPDATLVAGYKAWQNSFNRHVNHGEKGIRILAPAPYVVKEERNKLDPVTGELMLDKNGMPQTEEVEVRIPAFRAVSVFDISQTDGEPLPELEAEELLSTVEGYEDFIKAVTYVAPVPVSFEDIPGSSKGYFSNAEKRIAVQEGMSESQTLKTMVHEVAHSMLHDKEVNREADIPPKDRNTKEVEAESVAFTVCQHFGIDTSDYSFGYIAGWSSGKDMKELKSSLDTIRKTASELITGIERQLDELQRDRDLMQEQEKESLLLIQDNDLTEYSLLSVRGMDAAELVEALSAMSGEDRENIEAYLESKGAWTAEIANQDTKEWGEYHLDVRYVADRDEIIDLKTEKEMDERAKEPINADDVVLKITYGNGERFEVERITNKTPEEVEKIMGELAKLPDKNRNTIHECLKAAGADFVPIMVSGGRNSLMPQFNDVEIDLDKKDVSMMRHLSPARQAEGIINRLEYAKTAFSDEERSVIVNYAFKLGDVEKTRELAEHIYYEEAEGNGGAALAVIDAQAEIDALPDPMLGISEMEEYGYSWEEMLPLTREKALELFDRGLTVYLLYEDGTEAELGDRADADLHDGIFGIEKSDWENERNFREMQEELAESAPAKEAQLIYGSTDKYGIYQLKDSPELRDFHFAGTTELLKRNLLSDDFKEIQPGNYNLVYTGELSDIRGQAQGEKLNSLYEKFNIARPEDFKGHSLSVSDIVVLHEDGKNSAHFVDSYGFTELPHFTRALEGVKEQTADKEEIPLTDEEKQFLETDNAPLVAKKFLAWDEVEDLGYRFFEDGYIDKFKPIEKVLFGNGLVSDYAIHDLARRMQGGEDIREELAKALISGYERTINVGEHDAVAVFGNDGVTVTFGNAKQQISYEELGSGFLDLIENEYKDIEQARTAEEAEETSGHDVQKSEQTEPEETDSTSGHDVQKLEQPQEEQSETQISEQQTETDEPKQTAAEPDMEDGDEIIDLGDERDQVLAQMKQSLQGEQETELAFQIADRYISIHETDGGYDYSIMGTDYKEIDGGVYDNPDISIREALDEIVADLKDNPFDNGARGNIREDDELTPIDYDELMEKNEQAEKTSLEEARDGMAAELNKAIYHIENGVIADFKAKTDELFHEISEMNPAEIEETVKCHIQAIIDGNGLEAEIVDAAVVGSRCRGLEREGSDLDVVVELSTNEREDVLFDTFNEDGLSIGGIKVDINPITTQRTGTLETYLPKVEEYLDGVREARENEPVSLFNIRMNDEERWFRNKSGLDAEGLCRAYAECKLPFVDMGQYGERIDIGEFASIEQGERLDFSIEFNAETDRITIFDGENHEEKGLRATLFPEQAEPEVTLTVAECGEFHNLGEFYANIPTVDEAVAIWKQIPPERMNGIPAIGISIHKQGDEPYQDTEIDILCGRRIDLEILDHIPEIKDNPQAMEVIAQLAAKLPDMEIDGKMSGEMEARVWEIRMPDLTPAEQLAVEVDRFVYGYDTEQYRNNSCSMTENVTELAEDFRNHDIMPLVEWLAEVCVQEKETEYGQRAEELLMKVAEYKPLAKIEEMEEQNYNMVDNVLNNGAGERAQKEENKREQELPAARASLKARLAEKKALISGQGKEHEAKENEKKNQREM